MHTLKPPLSVSSEWISSVEIANARLAPPSFVNVRKSSNNFVGGGIENEATGDYSTVAGGRNNIANSTNSVIGGGKDNEAKVNGTTVAGGEQNRIEGMASLSTIGGGSGNYITGSASVISGGALHWNRGEASVIGGGAGNRILFADDSTGPLTATISGGNYNVARNHFATIGGGHEVHATGLLSFVGGGGTEDHINPNYSNRAHGSYSVVVGGSSNEANGRYSFIGGGGYDPTMIDHHDTVRHDGNQALTDHSIIVGGRANLVRDNSVPLAGKYGTITGGHNLIAQSHAQTVMGYWNKPQGNRTQATKTSNDRLLIIGNGTGDETLRSNAFEVSANGHSIVYDELSILDAGGAEEANPSTAPIVGGTYVDNIVYAWGHVPPGVGVVTPISSFGILPIVNVVGNVYTITLNIVDPDGSPYSLTEGSVTASIVQGFGAPAPTCKTATVTNISGNSFQVLTWNLSNGCEARAEPFMFKVTGRKRTP